MTEEELETVGDNGEDTEPAKKSGFVAVVGKVFSMLASIVIVVLLGFMIYATLAAARGQIVSVFRQHRGCQLESVFFVGVFADGCFIKGDGFHRNGIR